MQTRPFSFLHPCLCLYAPTSQLSRSLNFFRSASALTVHTSRRILCAEAESEGGLLMDVGSKSRRGPGRTRDLPQPSVRAGEFPAAAAVTNPAPHHAPAPNHAPDSVSLSAESAALQADALLACLPGFVYRCRPDRERSVLTLAGMVGMVDGTGGAPVSCLNALVHPDDRKRVTAEIAAANDAGQPYALEYRLQAPGAREIWVADHGLALRAEDDAVVGLQGYVTEITYRRHLERALQEREQQVHLLTLATGDLIWEWDLGSDRMTARSSADSELGATALNITTGSAWLDAIADEDRERVRQRLTAAFEGDSRFWSAEYRLRTPQGSSIHVLDRGSIVRDAHGKALRMLGAAIDITERREAELDLTRAHALLYEQALLLDQARDAIIASRIDGEITYWNRGAQRLYGWSADEVFSRNMLDLVTEGRAHYAEGMRLALQHGDWQGEVAKQRRNGTVVVVETHLSLVRDEEGNPKALFAIETDITRRKEDERAIEKLAFYDPLTHLPNRRLLLDRLEQALAAARRSRRNGALLYIDLDNFKTLNDTLGHDKGDLLLREVARRLDASVRKSNTVARLGGDEFVVLLDELSYDQELAARQAEAVAQNVLERFIAPFLLDGHEQHSTPSIGITLFDADAPSAEEVLKRADLAMYQAKADGRNAARFFDPYMQAAIVSRVALETDMRASLQRKQFSLHFQPQVDWMGRTRGVEALVRWLHPQRGWVSPALFIPTAEESGLIVRLGGWILEEACKQLRAWAAHPDKTNWTVAVNVSVRQFNHPDFVDQVNAVLRKTGANPDRLKIELTESTLIQNVEGTIHKMRALKERGVGFSLDDFGTGYSSLSYLKRLPLDQLKIDQSFVRDVTSEQNDAEIARAILGLGRNLGLEVVAEGVETEAQRGFLHDEGCYLYQGFLFGRPQPAAQF